MRKAALKLAISIAAMPASLIFIGLTHYDFLWVIFLCSFPAIVLYWIDFGREIRNARGRGRLWVIFGILLGVPQAFFGLLSAAIGLTIVVWVLYNLLVERQPQFTGSFLSLGIGPALVAFGAGWLASAFRGDAGSSDGA